MSNFCINPRRSCEQFWIIFNHFSSSFDTTVMMMMVLRMIILRVMSMISISKSTMHRHHFVCVSWLWKSRLNSTCKQTLARLKKQTNVVSLFYHLMFSLQSRGCNWRDWCFFRQTEFGAAPKFSLGCFRSVLADFSGWNAPLMSPASTANTALVGKSAHSLR